MNDELDPRFKDVFYVVEADDFARHVLWREYFDGPRACISSWVSDDTQLGLPIGDFHGHTVFVSFYFATINGRRVMFYDPTSQVVDHRLVQKWLEKNVPAMKDKGRRHCDSTNFGNCVSEIARDVRASQ